MPEKRLFQLIVSVEDDLDVQLGWGTVSDLEDEVLFRLRVGQRWPTLGIEEFREVTDDR